MSSAESSAAQPVEPAPDRTPARPHRPRGSRAAGSPILYSASVPQEERRLTARLAALVPAAVLFPLDVATFLVAMALTDTVGPKTFVVLALILVFFHNADLYRSRLSLSVLDDAPALAGRSLAAGAGAMVLGGLDDGVAGTARLGTAAAFAVLCLASRSFAYTAIRMARRRQRLGLRLPLGSIEGRIRRIDRDAEARRPRGAIVGRRCNDRADRVR